MKRRLTAVFSAIVLAGMLTLVGIGIARACEDQQQFKLPVTARGYDVPNDGRYLDGIVTNDTSVTVACDRVMISFAEDTHSRVWEEWICSAPLAPGAWTSFHLDWPKSVPTTWTPVVDGLASPTSQSALALTVNSVSPASTDEDGVRTYTVNVTNPNTFPVADIDVVGVEKDATSSAFVDTLDGCGSDPIGGGQTAELAVTGSSPWATALVTDLHVTALEQPTIALSADTVAPVYGSPVTFTLALTHADGTPVTGDRTLTLLASADGEDWHDVRCLDTGTGSVSARVWPGRPLHYKAVYWDGNGFACAESAPILIAPKVAAGAPNVPASVKAKQAFRIKGRLNAGDKSAGKPVKVTAQRWRGGSRWTKGTTVTAAVDGTGNYSKTLKLTSSGKYRIRAYRAGAGYTPFKTVKVK